VEDPTAGQIIGQNLRTVRAKKLFSQQDLADRSKVAKPTIGKLEIGEIARPRRKTIEKLARVLGVTVDDLLEEPPHPKGEGRSSREPTLFNGLAAERPPVHISAAAGGGGGSTAGILVGLDEHFDAIVAPLQAAGLSEDEAAEVVGQEVRRRVGIG
jgi:transcriptional regulator with XRE-family HTH domain